ncbi:MAG: ATP-dependent zinc metalloprotease FtsH [Bacilli bacterium]|nr:ATP-dependent zinc metalloprotease FtsH [Bacilli bacterium]MCH4201738.1 ATP-dependent zinc metalloprotease FtsH [Bacilli bacterium]MCH4236184.1 ATP-dependent zinc metalloprotease FtsH [Bacilli bacterium]
MAVVIALFVYIVFQGSNSTITQKDQSNILAFIADNNITSVKTTTTTSVTYIEGVYGNNQAFSAVVDNAFYNNFVLDALKNETTLSSWQIVNAFKTSWWDSWGPTIILLVGTVVLVFFLFSRMSNSVNNSNSKAIEFNKSRARMVSDSKTKFADVAGCDAEKNEMMELVDYLKTPKKYSKFGAKIPKGVLLVGPPGTGKTLLAKAVAGEAHVPFFSISGSDFVEMFVGVGAGRVRDMFHQAKKNAPCLIFIDELDAVGRQRGAGLGGGNDEREQTLNQLLVEMDGFEDNSGIIVIAATNREDVLDPALLRAGRFDRKITVDLPDREGRAAIFRVHARNKKIAPNVDFNNLAQRTVGFSGADIESILNDAAILAIRKDEDMIYLADIDEAVDRRIAGPAKSSKGMNEHERKVVAYHEAGHAVIGLFLPYSDKVRKITIIPRGRTGGHVMMTPEDDRFLMTKNELEARIVGYLGGRTSEELFFKDVSTGAANDIEVATTIARSMVTEYGMSALGPIQYEKDTGSVFLGRDYASSQKNFSAEVAVEIDKAIRKIIEDAHDKARKILTEHHDDVVLIAETLLSNETITAEQIDYLMKNHVLPAEETNPNSLGLSEGDLPPEEKKEESSDDKEKGEVKE